MKKRYVYTALICLTSILCACGKDEVTQEGQTDGAATQQQETEYGDDAFVMSGEFNEEYNDEETLLLLNAYTFAKTEDGFINNDDLEAQIGPDALATHANAMATEMNMLYTINATELRADSGKYRYRLNQFISSNCVTPDGKPFVDTWVDTIIDTNASLTGTFKTTKDMVFFDNDELYVRGMLTLKVNACSDTAALSQMLPVNVQVGGTYSFIYDVAMEMTDEDLSASTNVSRIEDEEVPTANGEEDEVVIEGETDNKEAEEEPENNEGEEQQKEVVVATSVSNIGKIDHIFAVACW